LIQFDFEDRHQDELAVGTVWARRRGAVLSIFVHTVILALLLWYPDVRDWVLAEVLGQVEEAYQEERQEQREEERQRPPRFVFVEPLNDVPSLRPRPNVDLSDLDRRSQAPQRAAKPDNPAPFSLGNSPERVEAAREEMKQGPETEVPPSVEPPQPQPEEQLALNLPRADPGIPRSDSTSRPAPGALGEALRNFQRYVQNQTFSNPQGGTTDPGATIQFDTKGIEFGPWLRRFVAQVKRNWFIPTAAMTFRGHVVLQFNIHKDGRITDIAVVKPSGIEAFNRAAYNAILGSNPVEPLPPEYPDDRAFFTVTFYYNEPAP
jgi:TonB family protein